MSARRVPCIWGIAFALALFLALPATRGHAEDVDLELVLAVDVSSSVDPHEAELQREGYMQALVHGEVLRAISTGPFGRIAVVYVEYAGETYQKIVVGWTLLRAWEDAAAFTAKLSEIPVSSAPATSISAVIDFSRASLKTNLFRGLRQVIDVSGDGPNSDGRAVWDARDDAVGEGITINGLPILSSRPDPQGFSPAVGVTRHYRRHVIGGHGAFAIEVNEFQNFAAALVSKLVREIHGAPQLSENLVPEAFGTGISAMNEVHGRTSMFSLTQPHECRSSCAGTVPSSGP